MLEFSTNPNSQSRVNTKAFLIHVKLSHQPSKCVTRSIFSLHIKNFYVSLTLYPDLQQYTVLLYV